MWSTEAPTFGHVEYVANDQAKTLNSSLAFSVTLEKESERAVKHLHRTQIKVVPGGQYRYKIVSQTKASREISDESKFSIPTYNGEHSFLILADMGMPTNSLKFVVYEAVNQHYDAVFHVGDIAYNLQSNQGATGDIYMEAIQPFTAQVPYMTAPGDHERFDDYYHYRHRFSMPGIAWPMSRTRLWYSIDIGLTHFVSIDTQALYARSGLKETQVAWLKEDLAKANKNRNKVPWVIVLGHKPIYCTKSRDEQECDVQNSELRESLDDVFFSYGVDLYISGHKHNYERTWPMYRGRAFQMDTVNPSATIHIVSGALGHEIFQDEKGSDHVWLAFAMSDRELYGKIHVKNSTHLIWRALEAADNNEVDKIEIVQTAHGSFGTPGPEAVKDIAVEHHNRANPGSLAGGNAKLPPQPFYIVDSSTSPLVTYRRHLLYAIVFLLATGVLLMLRYIRKHMGSRILGKRFWL